MHLQRKQRSPPCPVKLSRGNHYATGRRYFRRKTIDIQFEIVPSRHELVRIHFDFFRKEYSCSAFACKWSFCEGVLVCGCGWKSLPPENYKRYFYICECKWSILFDGQRCPDFRTVSLRVLHLKRQRLY